MLKELRTFLAWSIGLAIGFQAMSFVAHFGYKTRTQGTSLASLAENLPSPPDSLAAFASQLTQLPLDEAVVTELEKSVESMPYETELAFENHGWRVILLGDSSPLIKAGYHVDDLIPSERIDSSLVSGQEEQNQLASRIVKVLNRLSQ